MVHAVDDEEGEARVSQVDVDATTADLVWRFSLRQSEHAHTTYVHTANLSSG